MSKFDNRADQSGNTLLPTKAQVMREKGKNDSQDSVDLRRFI
jgi:hypothetical protein